MIMYIYQENPLIELKIACENRKITSQQVHPLLEERRILSR